MYTEHVDPRTPVFVTDHSQRSSRLGSLETGDIVEQRQKAFVHDMSNTFIKFGRAQEYVSGNDEV